MPQPRLRLLSPRPASAVALESYLLRMAAGRSRAVMRLRLDVAARQLGAADATTLDWAALEYRALAGLLAGMTAADYAPATVRQTHAAVLGVLRECRRCGLIDGDRLAVLTADLPRPHGQRLPPRRSLTADELRGLLAAAQAPSGARRARNAALLAVLMATGVRSAELVALDLADLGADGRLVIRHGKGDKARVGWLTDPTARTLLAAWLERRGSEPGPLICGISRARQVQPERRLRSTYLRTLVAGWCHGAGIARCTPRMTRARPVPHSSEHVEQVALIQWCARLTPQYPELAELFAVPNGGQRNRIVAAKLKAEGVRPGVPDLLLLVPRGECHGLAIEMKTAIGTVSDAQKWWHLRLAHHGYAVRVCRGWQAAAATLVTYLTQRPHAWRDGRVVPLHRESLCTEAAC